MSPNCKPYLMIGKRNKSDDYLVYGTNHLIERGVFGFTGNAPVYIV
jgi:hypothetical protein